MPRSQMYDWTSGEEGMTWNPVAGGPCPHECGYCYVKDMQKKFPALGPKYDGEFRLSGDIKKRLTKKNVFVCSMTDLFCEAMPEWIINKVLDVVGNNPRNVFLFQSKNPERMAKFADRFPAGSFVVTTIESNRPTAGCKAPSMEERAKWIRIIKEENPDLYTSITVEPILKFDLTPFVELLHGAKPYFIAIGADSKEHGLEEPTKAEVEALIVALKEKRISLRPKHNISRILGRETL